MSGARGRFDPLPLIATVLVGIAAGLGGVALIEILRLVQHLGFGYSEGTFANGVDRATSGRRVLATTLGGLVVGFGWWLVRRSGPVVEVAEVMAEPALSLPLGRSTADAVTQVVAVGAGGSLGREGAPRQLGAAAAEFIADRFHLQPRLRRTLIASGAGAGLAAVYNVPLGGTLFALEVLLGSFALWDAAPALVTCVIATAIGWIVLPIGPIYQVPGFRLSASIVAYSLVIGPVAGLVSVGFSKLMTQARRRPPAGWRLPITLTVVFGAVGALSIPFPLLLGNGKGPAQAAFAGGLAMASVVALLVLKPVATALCLGGGAAGGLLTPAVATGALLGVVTGHWWTTFWSAGPVGALAVVSAAAVLAGVQRAPATAAVLLLEFTHPSVELALPVVIAVAGATFSQRLIRSHTTSDAQPDE